MTKQSTEDTEAADELATELAGLIENGMDVDEVHLDGNGLLRLVTADGENFRIKILRTESAPDDDVYEEEDEGEDLEDEG